MKKIVALFIACVFVVSMAVSVFADGEKPGSTRDNPVRIDWSVVKEQIAGNEDMAGKFVVSDEVSMKYYVPDVFKKVELVEEDIEAGFIDMYQLGNSSDDGAFAIAYYVGEGMDIEDYVAFLKENYNVVDVEYDMINGYDAISYNYADNDEMGFVTFMTENGNVIEFMFTPVTKDSFTKYLATIVASIMGETDPE